MTTFKDVLNNMAPEFGYVSENGPSSVEVEVLKNLDRSVKMDEVDTVTFGLETDDGKIVKVYVNVEQANDFEQALAKKLGEVDDIEEALNELSKEFEIVDVEWPQEAETASQDDDGITTDGSEIMDKKVYKSKEVTQGGSSEPNLNFENMNVGERFTFDLMAESADSSSVESRLNTGAQLMIYHAILELGIPAIALNRNPYRAAIVTGIREKAFHLNKNSSMKTALKMFVKRATDYEDDDKEDKTSEKRGQQNEGLDLMFEGIGKDFWTSFSELIKYLSPDPKAAENLLTSSRLEQLRSRSSGTLGGRVSQQLRTKLNDLMDTLKDSAKTPVTEGTITEATTLDEIAKVIADMLLLADSSKDGKQAKAITSSTQWNQLMSKIRLQVSQKFAGVARSKLNVVVSLISDATNKMAKKTQPPPVVESLLEDKCEWKFDKDGDDYKIGCAGIVIHLDGEEAEKVIKGLSNRDTVIVKDSEENKKFVFSPRGVNAQVKPVGSTQSFVMNSPDIEKLLNLFGEKSKEKVEEGIKNVTSSVYKRS